MCRMLAVAGRDVAEAREILGRFRAQARASANGPPDDRSHPHGWGLVRGGRGRAEYVARRASNAATDDAYPRVVAGLHEAEFFLAHFRNASVGRAELPNTHPFVAEGWAFCHNGTIKESGRLETAGHPYEGSTDSERYFRLFLHNLAAPGVEEALRLTVQKIDAGHRYSSITCLFTDGRTLYGYRRVGSEIGDCGTKECQMEYYSLGWGRVGKSVVVAQEPTYLGEVRDWQVVPDDGFLTWTPGAAPTVTPLNPNPAPAIR